MATPATCPTGSGRMQRSGRRTTSSSSTPRRHGHEEKRRGNVPRCWALDYVTRHLEEDPVKDTNVTRRRILESWLLRLTPSHFDLGRPGVLHITWDSTSLCLHYQSGSGDHGCQYKISGSEMSHLGDPEAARSQAVLTESSPWLKMRWRTWPRRCAGASTTSPRQGSKAAWLARCADDVDILQSASVPSWTGGPGGARQVGITGAPAAGQRHGTRCHQRVSSWAQTTCGAASSVRPSMAGVARHGTSATSPQRGK